jgi:thiamine biosynthesis lipoprotein
MFDLANRSSGKVGRGLVAFLASFCAIGCGYFTGYPKVGSPDIRVSEVRYTMGTLLDLTIYASSEERGRQLLDGAFAMAEELNRELSTWIAESPVSVFNRQRVTTPLLVSESLYRLTTMSERLSNETDGAFSIAVRPLVDMWETAARNNKLPTAKEISAAQELVSPSALEVFAPHSVRKRFPGVMIETGGIGKGYAVDAMLEFLRSQGVTTAFINFGRSSLGAIGAPPGEKGWVVDVALVEGSVDTRVLLRDETLSVSRARGNSFKVAGRSYAHIFDPATARPVDISRGAAVRGGSATEGEAYVKYLVIRGAPSAAIARRWGGARWMVREGDKVRESPRFADAPTSLSARISHE